MQTQPARLSTAHSDTLHISVNLEAKIGDYIIENKHRPTVMGMLIQW